MICSGPFGTSVHDAASGDRRAGEWEETDLGASCVAVSPDGTRFATGNDSSIHVWDLKTKRGLSQWIAHKGHVTGITFHPTEPRLASCGKDRIVRVWDLESQREVLSFHEHPGGVEKVAYSPDGEKLASCGWGNVLIVRDATVGGR